MTSGDEDLPADWEQTPENPPENLRRKWIERDYFGKETIPCPSCAKWIPSESLTCLFCNASVLPDTGLLGKIWRWLKKGMS